MTEDVDYNDVKLKQVLTLVDPTQIKLRIPEDICKVGNLTFREGYLLKSAAVGSSLCLFLSPDCLREKTRRVYPVNIVGYVEMVLDWEVVPESLKEYLRKKSC